MFEPHVYPCFHSFLHPMEWHNRALSIHSLDCPVPRWARSLLAFIFTSRLLHSLRLSNALLFQQHLLSASSFPFLLPHSSRSHSPSLCVSYQCCGRTVVLTQARPESRSKTPSDSTPKYSLSSGSYFQYFPSIDRTHHCSSCLDSVICYHSFTSFHKSIFWITVSLVLSHHLEPDVFNGPLGELLEIF